MSEPLWSVRQRKGMSVNQLAAKSGVPAISITEYESGLQIRSADLPKLAKALYVEEWDIQMTCSPRPKDRADAPPRAAVAAPKPKAAKPHITKTAAPPASARPSQIEHLLILTSQYFDKDRTVLEDELGKPLEELTRNEARQLLKHYQALLTESRASESGDQAPAKRRRAYLPEGVDRFELEYLTTQQEEEALLEFTLFDGRKVSGTIVGFGPYSITVCEEESSEEITLQKLAIAYYRRTDGNKDRDSSSPVNAWTGDAS